MTSLMKLLTETEIEELDNFLLDRLQEEDTESGKDEGIFRTLGYPVGRVKTKLSPYSPNTAGRI